MNRAALAFIAMLAPEIAWAQSTPPAAAPSSSVEHITYSVYAAGLQVLAMDSEVSLGGQDYRVDLDYHTTGVFSVVMSGDLHSFAQGSWADDLATPLRFASWGQIRGNPRETVIDYRHGQPSVTTLIPAQDQDRDPVPPALQRNTIDTLSAMALMVRTVNTTGKCDGRVVTFDGRRVLDITARTIGIETLSPTSRSSFSGPALRCELDGLQTAGFQHDVSESELHRIHKSTAWLAVVQPGGQKLPVRVNFETGFFGDATAYLTSAAPGSFPPP